MNPNSSPPNIHEQEIKTSRIRFHLLSKGDRSKTPVLFLHGNITSSRFFQEMLETLPEEFYGIAPDLRGFGKTEAKPIDATRGLRDFSDDLHALVNSLELCSNDRKLHIVGWSVGGSVAMQYAIDHPEHVKSLVLSAPMSPYGFGGSKDEKGTINFSDYAGSGAGTANPEFVKRLSEKDKSEESDFSPKQVMNKFFFAPPFRVAEEKEAAYLESILNTIVGADHYPGDSASSENWPTVAPGTRGMNNALSPKYCNLSAFSSITPKPSVLWIRGDKDLIVSDTSFFDFGYLGQLGAVPGWPGDEVYPPQPMIAQTRAVLEEYKKHGGTFREEIFEDCGHSPHIEKEEKFEKLLHSFLAE